MILFILAYIIYFIYRISECMHILQLNLYNENNRYLKWCKRNIKKAFYIGDIIPIILSIILFITNDKKIIDIVYVSTMFIYILNLILIYKKNREKENKIPLKNTSRIKRLFLTSLIIYLIPVYFIYKNVYIKYMFLLSTILILLIYIITFIANILNIPINKIEYLYYYKKAKNKLKNYNNLEVIGITGSYGKTSSKNILSEILNSKYITRPTPKNFNTPNGLMITVNNHLDKFDEILIAEMGAYKSGEIKELCDFVKPKYGILTIIGEAHLETFKSKENIQKTKFELIESLPSDGIGILNLDDEYQKNYKLKNNCQILWISTKEKCDCYATNIKSDNNGMSFTINLFNEKFDVKTKIYGIHNIYNILASTLLAYKLNVSINDIKNNIALLKNTEHRLEIKKINNFYMIDDAYNSNPLGAKNALDVLNNMKGTKVCVTPGMVEYGKKESKNNYEFGKNLANVCDYVILVGNTTNEIEKGLLDNKFDKNNIIKIKKVKESFSIVSQLKEHNKEIYALYENDLPDIY